MKRDKGIKENEKREKKEVATEEDEEQTTPRDEGLGDKKTKQARGTVEVECVNITNLAYNWHAVVERC